MVDWYSIDRNSSAVERGIAKKDDAMQIIEDYFSRIKLWYETAEEALAETMFGFQKSKEEFVEICIHSDEEISFKYEISMPRKILFLNFPKVITVEKTLRSKEEVKTGVSLFYDLDSGSFQSYIGA